jgi:hypothetical protein
MVRVGYFVYESPPQLFMSQQQGRSLAPSTSHSHRLWHIVSGIGRCFGWSRCIANIVLLLLRSTLMRAR